jgi:hypothetical protein
MNSSELNQKAIENFISSYNAFDVKGMLKDLHRDITFENISNGEVNLTTKGIIEFKNQAELAKLYFTGREQKITAIRHNNDHIEVDIDYSAVLAIDFPNGLKAGDKLELKGKSFFRFLDNKIIEIKDIS